MGFPTSGNGATTVWHRRPVSAGVSEIRFLRPKAVCLPLLKTNGASFPFSFEASVGQRSAARPPAPCNIVMRLITAPDVELGIGIPTRTALAIRADGQAEILGEGQIAVFRRR